ncbi:MNN2 (YBR015C) [Zygosaccharomyces parabailii]|uniref:ZYBA0S03-09560g1_1 n=1 Tax=Zygosaccharomyces bailii (strain CLIB 213 / ATCC 58445 / CBS 680 / BCRC 21525 / NBRC 1098 / NCYC 1416 / NRRL Y-2227) TaxID=1333698 RepID=A0A8J2X828_ZYGB2|nr:MNN2 (YBR015C) [Zygosaccharomyces parabailii]CDF89118.1 ZYBA0S03-09560g1_1 [Zygosaccharomyces bailii CLIB 213]CDH16202.1 related to Alpha-1,2-mannosyltransferase MNN2 [Zygosaccharomyces bailii ISA1307]
MALVTRRYGKALRLAVIVLILCMIFVGTSKYSSDQVAVTEEYLRKYLSGGQLEYALESVAAHGSNAANAIKQGAGYIKPAPAGSDSPDLLPVDSENTAKLKSFYTEVFTHLKNFSPDGRSERQYKDSCPLDGDVGFRPENYHEWPKLARDSLASCLEVSEEEKDMLKKNHAGYVDVLSSLVLSKNAYKGRGIVTVGGGRFSLLALLVIQTLRELGTTLPVEVFIPPSDMGETQFCESVLPQYNAKCIYLSDILPSDVIDNSEFTGYQFKSLSLIASSFEDVLFLDADNFPVKPLDDVFDLEPYKSTQFVLWPDFWRRTTQPVYYDIAGIAVSTTKRVRNCFDDLTPPEVYTKNPKQLSDVPFHDFEGSIPDVSTESGQLMISKSLHLPTILLALYYNVNGPTWYYPMFSQRAAGEGDKETFLAAANFYGLPYYQVKTATGVEGYHRANGEGFRGVAMLQHDLNQDYVRYEAAADAIEAKYGGKTAKSIKYDKNYSLDKFYKTFFGSEDSPLKECDVMFAHSHAPKFDPYGLWTNNELVEDGKHFRSYTSLRKINNYDLELSAIGNIHKFVCVDKVKFKYLTEKLQSDQDFYDMCDYVAKRHEFLLSSHEQATTQ